MIRPRIKNIYIYMLNMLRTLMGKVERMREQIDNVNTEMEILRMNHKKVRDKNTVTEKKNVFYGFNNKLDMAGGRITKLKDMTIETFKTEIRREKKWLKKKQHRT